MINTDQVQTLLNTGGTVVGASGDKIGKIGQVFLDDETGQPEWVTVKTGLFGGSESFVPLAEGNVTDDEIRVPYSQDKVKDAPRVADSDGHLSPDQEAELYNYYGLQYTENTNGFVGQDTVVGQDTSGPETDQAMTRSEEQLHVGKESVQTGKAKLRKYVVTENVTQTVPVSREEVRLEREPITDANRDQALAGADLSSEEHEVTLTEERVVVSKETVPVERVKLDKQTITEDQQVNEQVAKEQIEYDDSDLPGTAARRK